MARFSNPFSPRSLRSIATRQALLTVQHPRLSLPPEMVGESSLAASTRRILAAGEANPDLVNGYDPRPDAHHLLTALERHLNRCDQLLAAADDQPPLVRAQLRRSVYARHAQVISEMMDSVRAMAELADQLDQRRAAVA